MATSPGGHLSLPQRPLSCARTVAERYTVPGLGRHTTIRLARHGALAGVLGAAMVAAQEEEKA